MYMTAVPAAAAMPRAFSPATERAGKQAVRPMDEEARVGGLLAKLVRDGNIRSMEALASVIVASDWGRISAAASLPAEDGGCAWRSAPAAVRGMSGSLGGRWLASWKITAVARPGFTGWETFPIGPAKTARSLTSESFFFTGSNDQGIA